MNITSCTRQEIEEGIENAQEEHHGASGEIRLLLAPEVINEGNFEQACNLYSRVDMSDYETVVVIEPQDQILEKKLSIASSGIFETPLGEVPANDRIRSEFCNANDDFFIHDEAFDRDSGLFQQLMFLQTLSDDFSVVSIQITDDNPATVEELAAVIEEVLASGNVLLVFCCELDREFYEEFQKIEKMVQNSNHSGLLNYLNSGASEIKGAASFIAGVLVAHSWKLDLTFLEQDEVRGSLLTAYAGRQDVAYV